MSEITVLAFAEAKPGRAEDLEKAFCEAVLATHNEPGCLKYALQRDAKNKNAFVMIEKWRSQEDLNKHLEAPHIKDALFQKLSDLLATPIRIQVFNSVQKGLPEKLV